MYAYQKRLYCLFIIFNFAVLQTIVQIAHANPKLSPTREAKQYDISAVGVIPFSQMTNEQKNAIIQAINKDQLNYQKMTEEDQDAIMEYLGTEALDGEEAIDSEEAIDEDNSGKMVMGRGAVAIDSGSDYSGSAYVEYDVPNSKERDYLLADTSDNISRMKEDLRDYISAETPELPEAASLIAENAAAGSLTHESNNVANSLTAKNRVPGTVTAEHYLEDFKVAESSIFKELAEIINSARYLLVPAAILTGSCIGMSLTCLYRNYRLRRNIVKKENNPTESQA